MPDVSEIEKVHPVYDELLRVLTEFVESYEGAPPTKTRLRALINDKAHQQQRVDWAIRLYLAPSS